MSERREIEDPLLTGSWEVDCVKMTLTQNETASPLKYSGKGYLRQREDGTIRFRLYPDGPVSRFTDLMLEGSDQVASIGKIVPPSSYSTLVAKDIVGRE